MARDRQCVTFEVGQSVSIWLGGRLGQVEDLHITCVTVLYRSAGQLFRLCRVRVSARDLAMYQDLEPPVRPTFNPFNRGVVRRAKTFDVEPHSHVARPAAAKEVR